MSSGDHNGGAVPEILRSGESALSAWEAYYSLHSPSGVNGTEAFAEASSRLRLIALCLDRVLEHHARLEVRWQKGSELDLDHINLLVGPLRLDTESFYWQCGRFRGLVRRLPGLTTFEASGVRDVRNKLIEHPESRDSQVLVYSFGWHPDRGPVIKGSRIVGTSDAFPDAGLFANAKSFYEELSRKLVAHLRAMPTPSP